MRAKMALLIMSSTFKKLILALLITFSLLAVTKVAKASDDILTYTAQQWYMINEITEEVIVPIAKSLVPVVKDAGNVAIEKSSEAVEFVKNSFDNMTKYPPPSGMRR